MIEIENSMGYPEVGHGRHGCAGDGRCKTWFRKIGIMKLRTLTIIFCTLILSAPAFGGPVFQLRLFNVDDIFTALITNSSFTNQQILQTAFGNDSGLVDISSFVQPGTNLIHVSLFNDFGGWTYGFDFGINGTTFDSGSCGTTGVVGCNNNDQAHQHQIAFTHDIQFQGPASGVPEPSSAWFAALGLLTLAVRLLHRCRCLRYRSR